MLLFGTSRIIDYAESRTPAREMWDVVHVCFGVVMVRPEAMCTRTNFLGPLVPKLIVPEHTMSLEWYIPVIVCTGTQEGPVCHSLKIENCFQYYYLFLTCRWYSADLSVHIEQCASAGTLCFWDDSFWGPGVPEIRSEKHRFGTSHHPTLP